ncbi:hypothetical protein [Cerasicoccus maritimus]|uniref:hypothetical protein n=1 Tax=Cerasicoccus maritimus TaxID=490089 RepID=UPI002852C1EF|nr:hypothetical protein [Cerasicoccus maritimus]
MFLLVACSPEPEAPPTPQDHADKPAPRALSRSEQFDRDFALIEHGNVQDWAELYGRMMDELDTGRPFLAANLLDALLTQWAEQDASNLATTISQDPRCVLHELSPQPVQVLSRENPEALLKICQEHDLRGAAKYAAYLLKGTDAAAPFQAWLNEQADSGQPNAKSIYALAETDSEKALNLMRIHLGPETDTDTTITLLRRIYEGEPEGAAKYALDYVSDHPDQASRFAFIVANWAAVDPDAAIMAIDSQPSLTAINELLPDAMLVWARTEPVAALDFATNNIVATGIRQQVLTDILSQWMERDPAAASEYAIALPSYEIRMMSTVFQPWVQQDPESAMNAVSSRMVGLRSLATNSTSHQRLIGFWADKDLGAATEWALTLPPGRTRNHYLLELASHYRHNPERAAELISAINENWARDKATESMLDSWGAQDPASALAWVESVPIENRNPDMEESLFEGWASESPQEAAKYLASSEKINNKDLVEAVANDFYRQDPAAAAKWIRTLPTAAQKHANAEIAKSLSRRTPVKAAAYLKDLPDEAYDVNAINPIARSWGRKDPPAALEWALSLNDEVRTNGVIISLYGYLRQTPDTVEQWTTSLEAGSLEHSAAAYACSLHFEEIDAIKSARYAAQIQDPDRRKKAFGTIFWDESKERKQQILDDARASGTFTEAELANVQEYVK